MITICPNCGERIVTGFGVTDVEHRCRSGNTSIDEEDVIKIGNWEDYTGSGVIPKNRVMWQGVHNELEGTTAGIQGKDKEEVTKRGKRKSTHRSRQHYQYINLKSGGLN